MLNGILEKIKQNRINAYDIAIMTDHGIESAYCQPGNACNESYSVAKVFIATAIGILVGRGLLSVEDKITGFLSSELPTDYDPLWNDVTIHHALTHTMGISYGMIDVDRDDPNDYKNGDYLALIFSERLKYKPGTQYVNTDVPHYLLSRVISKITGMKADEFLLFELLNPLQFRPVAWLRCPRGYTIGATGLYARAADLVKLPWAYLNGGVFDGKQIIPGQWVKSAVEHHYSLSPIGDNVFYGTGGMNGQMLLYSPEYRFAAAWHAYEPAARKVSIANICEEAMKGGKG